MRHQLRLLTIILLTLLTACAQAQIVPTSTPNPTATPEPTAAPTQQPTPLPPISLQPAILRIVNAVQDSGSINVFIGFSAIATNLAYQQFTEPTQLEAGEFVLKVVPSGGRQDDPALFETTINLVSNVPYITILTGSGSSINILNVPETSTPLNAGESTLTLINVLNDSTAAILRTDDRDITSAVPPGESGSTSIIAADIPVSLLIGDQPTSLSPELKTQQNTVAIIAGSSADPRLISFGRNAPGRVAVHALNAAFDLPSADVYLGEAILNVGVEYGRPTSRQSFATGEYTAAVYPAGADRTITEPLLSQVVQLADENMAIMLLGSSGNYRLVSYAEDLTPVTTGQSRLAFVNTLSERSEVDLQTTSDTPVPIDQLYFGQPPEAVTISAGSYSFLFNAADATNTRSTIERSENVQLEPGYAYLYLVTGRLEGAPLIISEPIAVEGGSTLDSSAPNAQLPQIRLINAIQGSTLDLLLGDNLAIQGIGYGQGSTFTALPDVNAPFIVLSGGDEVANQLDNTFELNNTYTLIVYGETVRSANLLLLPDSNLIFDGSSPYLRFINVSTDEDVLLGLGFSALSPTPLPTAASTEEDEVQPDRFTIPVGIQRLVSNIQPANASDPILMPVGNFDLDIIDNVSNQLAYSLWNTALNAGEHIDVIAYQQASGTAVRAFAIVYPRPPA